MRSVLIALILIVSVNVMPAVSADDLATQWQTISRIEEKLAGLNREAATVRAQLDETGRKIAALKQDGVSLLEEIRLNVLLRESQDQAQQLATLEGTIRTLADTRLTLVDRALLAVNRELARRAERLKALQAAGDHAGFTQLLTELVGYDNFKRALEERRELRLARPAVTLQVADWNSPAEVREKALILRDEIRGAERELALTRTRISEGLAEIRQKEEIIRFVRDLQQLRSERVSVVDPAVIPHLEREAERRRGEIAQLRQYQGTLTVELARLREQGDRLTAYADRMERELLR